MIKKPCPKNYPLSLLIQFSQQQQMEKLKKSIQHKQDLNHTGTGKKMQKFNKEKWFVIATEGATCDDRTIARSWIEQMAKNYDPQKTYGARINLEHVKFWRYNKDEPHALSYGDVIDLKTQEREDGKLQLLAKLSPTAELIELNKARQKIYTSVEIDTNFADTGEAYLVGLAVTDNPASLGTEMLQFSAQAKANPLENRKLKADNLFTAAVEQHFEFVEEQEANAEVETEKAEEQDESFSLLEKIRALFTEPNETETEATDFNEHSEVVELLAQESNKTAEDLKALMAKVDNQTKQIDELNKVIAGLESKFKQFEETPNDTYTARPIVTGESQADGGRYF